MAKHEKDFNDIQEKGLIFVTDKYNSEQIKANPQFIALTVDEYFSFVLDSVGNSWAKQANIAIQEPLLDDIKKVIESGDSAKLQTIKDAIDSVKVADIASVII